MRVLSIDGGGIRGIVPAVVLAELEDRVGRPVGEVFDLIAGTSTGGILACATARGIAAKDLVGLYRERGPQIFSRSALRRITSADGYLDERYDNVELRRALEDYFGDARLSDVAPEVFVTAYELHQRFAFFFRSSRARQRPDYDFTLVDVCMATAAAPTYFEPVAVTDVAGAGTYALVDGGVFATNPAMCAYADVAAGGVDLLLSLGTGAQTRPIQIDDARRWGKLGWVTHIVDVVFDGVSETVDFQLGRFLGDGYVRLQTDLMGANDDMDDASPQNLIALEGVARKVIEDNSEVIDRLARELRA